VNQLIPHDVIVIRNHGVDPRECKQHQRGAGSQGNWHNKVEAEPKSTSNVFPIPGPVRTKNDTQDAYKLHFGHSTYTPKDKEIRFLFSNGIDPTSKFN
jgi:hypothetical protein